MKKMDQLIRQVRQLERQVDVCTRCGMCQAVCPVYGVTGNEADVARGKLSLISGLIRDMFADPDGVYDRLERCLLCGACAAECPRGVDAMAVFLKTRALIREFRGLPVYEKVLFRRILGVPGRFDRMADWAARCQHLVSTPVPAAPPESPLISPLFIGRQLPPLSAVPFRKKVQNHNLSSGGEITVALFTGCLIDKVFPEVGMAILEILDHHGIGVVVPENQGCCGIPALSAGDREGFKRLVAHQLDCFDLHRPDFIVSGCATCTAVIKTIWPALYPAPSESTRARIDGMAAKTMDIAEFIFRVTGISDRFDNAGPADPVPVTYHDPCHLKRTLGVSEAPRRLIAANPNYTLVEMARPEACCGMGGSFGLRHKSISMAIGEKKTADIADSRADIVATGCPACMMQLRDLCSRSALPVIVRHTVEIYARGLKKK